MKSILINCLGIQDSGGITVLGKLLAEIKGTQYDYFIICNENINISNLIKKYNEIEKFKFLVVPSKGFLYRLYFENVIFRKFIEEKKMDLVYNFSGSAQFFSKVSQITKVHNLLFYSKKMDYVYFEKKEYFKWFKQIFLKRVVFHSMIQRNDYIEVQSNHVKEYMSDFIDTSKKVFFIKTDIEVDSDKFVQPKKYAFTRKIRFLYIVGPHFDYLHKNFIDFVNAMKLLKEENLDFEIVLTLSKDQLHNSNLWDKELDEHTKFLGYVSKDELKKYFQDNTILVSTSVIETLGLHVIEAVQNGILATTPNEKYSLDVYGKNILTYDLFDSKSLVQVIKNIILQDTNEITDRILKSQQYLIENENRKYQNIVDIFDNVIKEKNV